jgi:hypothetical protein
MVNRFSEFIINSGRGDTTILPLLGMSTRGILNCVARYQEKRVARLSDTVQKGNRMLLSEALWAQVRQPIT